MMRALSLSMMLLVTAGVAAAQDGDDLDHVADVKLRVAAAGFVPGSSATKVRVVPPTSIVSAYPGFLITYRTFREAGRFP